VRDMRLGVVRNVLGICSDEMAADRGSVSLTLCWNLANLSHLDLT
jgi:hypothetical protein